MRNGFSLVDFFKGEEGFVNVIMECFKSSCF